MSALAGIRLAAQSMQAMQAAIEVAGQNVSNADTPGYTRQVAVLSPILGPAGTGLDGSGNPVAQGGGVDVAQILRSRAAWLDGEAGRLDAQSSGAALSGQYVGQAESLLAEPTDSGLQATLDRFFSAASALSTNPTDGAARDAFLRAGRDVAARFSELTGGLDTLSTDVRERTQSTLDGINQDARQVATLSARIRQAQAAGANPNELLDQRDRLLQDLQRKTGATVSGRDSGELVVSLGGRILVQGDHADTLQVASNTPVRFSLSDGTAVTSPGGELGTLQDLANSVLPQYRTAIAGVRDGLAAQVNALHQSGTDLSGSPGLPFFTADAGGNLTVNPALTADRSKVAAGSGGPGDGSLAAKMADLGSGPASVTVGYRAFVSRIGSDVSALKQEGDRTKASLTQVQTLQASESGVNIDEELANIVSLQHVYSASARVLSTYDQMIDTLLTTGR